MAASIRSLVECFAAATRLGGSGNQAGGPDAVYYGQRMRGVSNAKAKRELDLQPRPLEWIMNSTLHPTS
jgi:hypothetical protein